MRVLPRKSFRAIPMALPRPKGGYGAAFVAACCSACRLWWC